MTTHVFYLFYYLFLTSLDFHFGFCRAKVLTYLRRQKMTQLLLSQAGRYLAFIEISMFIYPCRLNSNESLSIICRRRRRRLARLTRENPRFQLFDFRALLKASLHLKVIRVKKGVFLQFRPPPECYQLSLLIICYFPKYVLVLTNGSELTNV